MLQNRVATNRMGETTSSATVLLAGMSSSPSNTLQNLQGLQGRQSLYKHLLLLDAAVYRCTSEDLWALREEGKFARVALATNESPPSQPRFRGLRFPITVMYWGAFLPMEDWGKSTNPPTLQRSCLGDIMHCPGKNGLDVCKAIEKQLARAGVNCFDVVAATKDGGGERRAIKMFMLTSRTLDQTMFVEYASHAFPGGLVTSPLGSLA